MLVVDAVSVALNLRWHARWITIGIVYHPDHVRDPWSSRYDCERAHESIHVRQQARWPSWLRWLWFVLYACAPIPIVFAWFRWRAERAAFLVELTTYGRDLDSVIDALWSSYAWAWPRPLMRRWFARQLSPLQLAAAVLRPPAEN